MLDYISDAMTKLSLRAQPSLKAKYSPFFTTVNSPVDLQCAIIRATDREEGTSNMIDGWLLLVLISFVSAVCGLSVLLIQSCLGEHGETLRHTEAHNELMASSVTYRFESADNLHNNVRSYAPSPRSSLPDRVPAPRDR
jgi:hypothetical protein